MFRRRPGCAIGEYTDLTDEGLLKRDALDRLAPALLEHETFDAHLAQAAAGIPAAPAAVDPPERERERGFRPWATL